MLFSYPHQACLLSAHCMQAVQGGGSWKPRLSVGQPHDHVGGNCTLACSARLYEVCKHQARNHGRQAAHRKNGGGRPYTWTRKDRGQKSGEPPGPTCSTRLIHWKLSSSEASGRCSATSTIRSSCSTVTENTAILGEDKDKNDHPGKDTEQDTDICSHLDNA